MYIVCKTFYGKTISGSLLLSEGTELSVIDNLLYFNNKPICYITSQNCYDYMADNINGDGKERYNIIQDIKRIYSNIIKRDNDNYATLITGLNPETDTMPEYVSSLPFNINFDFNFYNKTINELNDILGGLTNE